MKLSNTAQITDVITLGGRSSKLSVKQIEEVVDAMRYYYPQIKFCCRTCPSKGDKDLTSSLRDLEKTNFFTQELDQWVQDGFCQVAVHSAKDLPDPLPDGLEIIALTASRCSSDVVVFQPGIKPKPNDKTTIATSSQKREERVLKQWPQAKIVDLRGSIDQRLNLLKTGAIDGIVVAKVALMRLGYTNLNIQPLMGESAAHQGSLAVIAKKGQSKLKKLFEVIDSRRNKKIWYAGLDPIAFLGPGEVFHAPLIEVRPKPYEALKPHISALQKASHLIFTSQSSVKFLFELLAFYALDPSILESKRLIAVGQMSAKALQRKGLYCAYVPKRESQEGIIELLDQLTFRADDLIVYPKSSLSRPHLLDYLTQRGLQLRVFDLYETHRLKIQDKLDPKGFDHIVLTSPSCVKSFFENCPNFQDLDKILCKGEVTRKALPLI